MRQLWFNKLPLILRQIQVVVVEVAPIPKLKTADNILVNQKMNSLTNHGQIGGGGRENLHNSHPIPSIKSEI